MRSPSNRNPLESERLVSALPPAHKQFLLKYGEVVGVDHLRQLLKIPNRNNVDRIREALGLRTRRFAQRNLSYRQAFERLHGRPPRTSDYPSHHIGTRFSWHLEEDDVLRQWRGLLPRQELADRISRRLQQVTGDPHARRSADAVQSRANNLKITGPQVQGHLGPTIKEASRSTGISFNIIYQAVARGELPVQGRAHYRYISWQAWQTWRDNYLRAQQILADKKEELPEPCTDTKTALNALGVSEAHLGRMLKFGLLRAWKIGRSWHIAIESLNSLKRQRASGDYQLESNAFTQERQRTNAEAVRRRHKKLRRKKIMHGTAFVSATQLAAQCGVTCARIRSDIVYKKVRGKKQYGQWWVPSIDARAYALALRNNPGGRWQARRQEALKEISERRGVTRVEAMHLLKVGMTQLKRFASRGWLHPFYVSGYAAFPRAEVEQLLCQRQKHKPVVGRAATIQKMCPSGCIPLSEAKRRVGDRAKVTRRLMGEALCVNAGRSKLYFVPARLVKQIGGGL